MKPNRYFYPGLVLGIILIILAAYMTSIRIGYLERNGGVICYHTDGCQVYSWAWVFYLVGALAMIVGVAQPYLPKQPKTS